MNWKHLLLAACLLPIMPRQLFGQVTNVPPYSAIYAFGDCLTATYTPGLLWPNWQGRTANGPMWIEKASTNLGLIYRVANNFAVSAWTTTNVLNRVRSFSVPAGASNALFVVWAGPVDFYWHLGPDVFSTATAAAIFTSPTNDQAWQSMIAPGVNNLSNCVANLYSKGARSFLVPNVDDVSRQPVVITWHSEDTRTGLQQRVKQFNSALAQAISSLDQTYPDLRIVSPDAFGLFSDFIDYPTNYDLTVTYPAAMQDDGLVDQSLNGPGADYVFWDQYGHPTTKTHGYIAANFMNALTNARPEKLTVITTNNSRMLNASKLLIGRAYVVQASENLTNWQDVYPFTAIAGTNQWTDSTVGGTTRFYRLAWNP
jgi:phospholipase/lecithinase/hemolysin